MRLLNCFIAGVISITLASCASTQFQQLEKDVFYKRDLGVRVNGVLYEGVVTIPESTTAYEMELVAPADIDMVLWRSCAREDSGSPNKPGLFKFLSSKEVKYTYTPNPGQENKDTCPLRIDAYDAKNNQHSWAFLSFERKEFKLEFELDCNARRQSFNGVGSCQHKSDLPMRAHFGEEVRFAPPKPAGCAVPKKVPGEFGVWTWPMTTGECVYKAENRDGEKARFIGIGYQGVLIRGGV
jgi:hypothetical protein